MKFHELELGKTFTTQPFTFTKEEIIKYASEYDQHYFHIDEEKAKNSIYGGIILSGLHLINRINTEWIRLGKLGDDIIAGVGMDQVVWKRPVYPNDIIIAEMTILDKKMRSDEVTGIVTVGFTARNQENKMVISTNVKYLMKC